MTTRKPVFVSPATLLEEADTLEKTLARAAAIMVEDGVLAIPPRLLAGLDCADNMRSLRDQVRSCIESAQLDKHLREHGFEDPERCKQVLFDTMMVNSNPVQPMTFSGSYWQIQTARAIGTKGFWGALQITLESGLHAYPIREIMKASTMIVTLEASIGGESMQKDNYHTDCSKERQLIYAAAWRLYAEFMGWDRASSLITEGQLQLQVNMGEEVDPNNQNTLMAIDHRYNIPPELLSTEEVQPAAKKRKMAAVSHYEKLSSKVSPEAASHLEKNALHRYLEQGLGFGFAWTAMRPDDEVQPSGLGIHGGIAPLNGRPKEAPMKPRLATVIGAQTLPTMALLNTPNLLTCVARSVFEVSEGWGGCHTFLAKANRPPSFANGYGAGKHKDVPKTDMSRLRKLRVADATMPGPEGGFRHEKSVPFNEWSDMHLETVRNYIETRTVSPSTPTVIQNALAFCIRSVEFSD